MTIIRCYTRDSQEGHKSRRKTECGFVRNIESLPGLLCDSLSTDSKGSHFLLIQHTAGLLGPETFPEAWPWGCCVWGSPLWGRAAPHGHPNRTQAEQISPQKPPCLVPPWPSQDRMLTCRALGLSASGPLLLGTTLQDRCHCVLSQ